MVNLVKSLWKLYTKRPQLRDSPLCRRQGNRNTFKCVSGNKRNTSLPSIFCCERLSREGSSAYLQRPSVYKLLLIRIQHSMPLKVGGESGDDVCPLNTKAESWFHWRWGDDSASCRTFWHVKMTFVKKTLSAHSVHTHPGMRRRLIRQTEVVCVCVCVRKKY